MTICRTSELNKGDDTGGGLSSKPKIEIILESMAVIKRPVHKALVSAIALSLQSKDRQDPILTSGSI